MKEKQITKISITADGVWAGDGVMRDGHVEDCSAILGGSQDDADRIYEAIDDAIASSDNSVSDGGVLYEWSINWA